MMRRVVRVERMFGQKEMDKKKLESVENNGQKETRKCEV